jgi:hypothetical protein
MKITTLEGEPTTIAELAEKAKEWYAKHGEDGYGDRPTPVPVRPPPYSFRCQFGHHAQCRGRRMATKVSGVGVRVRCECPHHDD